MNFSLFITRVEKLLQVLRQMRGLKALLYYRVLAGVEHRCVLRRDLSTVVDIGSNRGQFSLAARIIVPHSKIFAFEPLPKPAATFLKIFQRDSMTIFHQVAIGPKTGEMTIHVSAADDSSSLLPISSLQNDLFPGTDEIRTETVRVGRLSDFLISESIIAPAMLKLDVQGFELEALRGCEALLECFLYVYVECSFIELYAGQSLAHEVIAWLGERGFRLIGAYHMSYDRNGHAVQGDFLFSRR